MGVICTGYTVVVVYQGDGSNFTHLVSGLLTVVRLGSKIPSDASALHAQTGK